MRIHVLGLLAASTMFSPAQTVPQNAWVETKPPAAAGSWAWNWDKQEKDGLFRGSDFGATWRSISRTSSAFDVPRTSNIVAPEPAVMSLVASGLLGLAALGRRKRKRD